MSFRETAGCEASSADITGANSAKRGQLAVWSLGLLIFFDDYSNTLVVGNTSRSITDRLRISRGKTLPCGLHCRTAGDGSPRDHLDRLSGEPDW